MGRGVKRQHSTEEYPMDKNLQNTSLSERMKIFSHLSYVPWQPGFENFAKEYQGSIVDEKDCLRGIVADFYQIDGGDFDGDTITTIPDGCTDLIFTVGSRDVKSYISTGVRELKHFVFQKPEYIFGIRFMPGATYRMFHDPIKEIVHKPIPMDLVLKDSGRFIDEIITAKNFSGRIAAAGRFILGHVLDETGKERIMEYCLARIYETRGSVPLGQLSEETGYSERYLGMIFDEYVGISPKNMCNIVRIQYAYLLMVRYPEQSLAYVAQYAGYADHSHMNREFQRYLNDSAGKVRSKEIFQRKDAGNVILFS